MRVIVFTGHNAPETRNTILEELENLGVHSIVTFDSSDAVTGFLNSIRHSLSGGNRCLCIVAGYSFDEPEAAGIFAEAIDEGMRLLVFDMVLDNKLLAERLNIVNIKHKVRIEKFDLNDRDDPAKRLLPGIVLDEIRRIAKPD